MCNLLRVGDGQYSLVGWEFRCWGSVNTKTSQILLPKDTEVYWIHSHLLKKCYGKFVCRAWLADNHSTYRSLCNLYSHRFNQTEWYQEFSNPLVCLHIHTYSEDAGENLKETCHADKWCLEVNGNISASMVWTNSRNDFFIEEPCLIECQNQVVLRLVVPIQWFEWVGKMWAIVHPLKKLKDGTYYIDGQTQEEYLLLCIVLSRKDL